jgi:hypothetical protein
VWADAITSSRIDARPNDLEKGKSSSMNDKALMRSRAGKNDKTRMSKTKTKALFTRIFPVETSKGDAPCRNFKMS